MNVRRFLAVLPCAAALATIPAAIWAQDVFQGAGQNSEMDCAGSSAKIEGASNRIVVTGRCTLLTIEGASNRVRVDMAKNGTIQVVGADNEIHWTTPDGSKPRLRITGAANRISGAPAK